MAGKDKRLREDSKAWLVGEMNILHKITYKNTNDHFRNGFAKITFQQKKSLYGWYIK